MSAVTRHDCEWYAISYAITEDRPWKPVLWACGVTWNCTKTTTRISKGRGKKRKKYDPETTIPVPTKGMWGVIKDKPPEDT